MTTLVTGGSGIVGRALLRELGRRGRPVRALVRSDTAAAAVAELGAEPIRGDVLDPESLGQAMRQCEVVYHVAGYNEMCLRNPAPLFRVNVEGARNTLRAAAGADVRRLVFTSSATTIGEVRGTVGSESSPHRGSFLSSYERSKYEAEQLMLADDSGVEVVVVNPSSVQGPGRATGTGRLFLDLVNGKLPAVVDSRVSIVDIDDCARGHVLAELNGVAGQRYLLSGFTLGTRQAVELLEQVSGLRFRLVTVPPVLATVAATSVEMGARILGRHPRFCREMARVLMFGHAYDGSRATRELGLEYTPPEETLRRTLDWFVEQELVERALPGLG